MGSSHLAHRQTRPFELRADAETVSKFERSYKIERAPFRLEAARADSALLKDPAGWMIQIVHYDPDSPDR